MRSIFTEIHQDELLRLGVDLSKADNYLNSMETLLEDVSETVSAMITHMYDIYESRNLKAFKELERAMMKMKSKFNKYDKQFFGQLQAFNKMY